MTPTLKQSPACVLAYPRRAEASEHEVASQSRMASLLASLLGCAVRESAEPALPDSTYYVPDHTLVANLDDVEISDESRLFGGIVPHGFVATKAVTHGLWQASSQAPAGWNALLGGDLGDAVLTGYTVFTRDDALSAGRALLQRGPVRLKPIYANAGRGQCVVEDATALQRAIEASDAEGGLVLEENLTNVRTFSVGWCRVGPHHIAYTGTQCLTPDNQGELVYGGSSLRCVRGDVHTLAGMSADADMRRAAQLAVQYDAAVNRAYPALIASRRNYDVVIGRDYDGQTRLGVLEQSWRAGGASIAELSAMLYFAQNASASEVYAYTCEEYGPHPRPFAETHLVYSGEDSRVGWITKTGGIGKGGTDGAQ
ncbi:DUF3182 family protein [Bordetella sp. 15P40C-2]|uniref:DUF3182 family protein n=1 Tax=Bordetella sp. 15P40C-2 TaxID=2572246 RepID=UPI001327EDC4|nr:DUF3182 family protein [Bordetella sp. 15P40C-2]MVW73232.1 DUF3182 family protein [Bordetella sp. 15P40C-2]